MGNLPYRTGPAPRWTSNPVRGSSQPYAIVAPTSNSGLVVDRPICSLVVPALAYTAHRAAYLFGIDICRGAGPRGSQNRTNPYWKLGTASRRRRGVVADRVRRHHHRFGLYLRSTHSGRHTAAGL